MKLIKCWYWRNSVHEQDGNCDCLFITKDEQEKETHLCQSSRFEWTITWSSGRVLDRCLTDNRFTELPAWKCLIFIVVGTFYQSSELFLFLFLIRFEDERQQEELIV